MFPQQISDEAWREVRDAQSRTHRASHPQHSRTSIAQRTKVAVSLPHCVHGTGFEYGNHKKESAANSAICREEHTSSRAPLALHWPTTVRRQPTHRKQTKQRQKIMSDMKSTTATDDWSRAKAERSARSKSKRAEEQGEAGNATIAELHLAALQEGNAGGDDDDNVKGCDAASPILAPTHEEAREPPPKKMKQGKMKKSKHPTAKVMLKRAREVGLAVDQEVVAKLPEVALVEPGAGVGGAAARRPAQIEHTEGIPGLDDELALPEGKPSLQPGKRRRLLPKSGSAGDVILLPPPAPSAQTDAAEEQAALQAQQKEQQQQQQVQQQQQQLQQQRQQQQQQEQSSEPLQQLAEQKEADPASAFVDSMFVARERVDDGDVDWFDEVLNGNGLQHVKVELEELQQFEGAEEAAAESQPLVHERSVRDERYDATLAFAPAASDTLSVAAVDASDAWFDDMFNQGGKLAIGELTDEQYMPPASAGIEPTARHAAHGGKRKRTRFVGDDDLDDAKRDALIDQLVSELPKSWRRQLLRGGSEQSEAAHKVSESLSDDLRIRAAIKILGKSGQGPLSNALRYVKLHRQFCLAEGISMYPVPADILACELEEYDAGATDRAERRAEKQRKLGKEAKGRGGATAAEAVRLGAKHLQDKLGLSIAADSPLCKVIAKAGKGMPKIRQMLPIDALAAYAFESQDSTSTEFTRAYAGACYLGGASSLRVIDQRRTPSLRFELVEVEGEEVTIACGVTRVSKDKNRATMKPLAWRAPIIQIGPKHVDLAPLLDSFVEDEDGTITGSMYRDFEVPEGAKKVITNAIGWKDKVAPYKTVVASQVAILSLYLGAARARVLGGHDQRHTVPEIARVLGLARSVREGLGYWRSPPEVADDEADAQARARAINAARTVRSRAGAIAFSSDRYSSADGQQIEQDWARVACLKVAAAVAGAKGLEKLGQMKPSEQLTACKRMVNKAAA